MFPVIDVRSPAEFAQGHIPGAINVPLFNNEERAKIGTAYVQISREEAIRIGYEIANPKINSFIFKVQNIVEKKTSALNFKPETLLVHCWRGGMRSSKFAILLNKHGYQTHTLVKGYKAYRNFVLESFSPDNYQNAEILIIGGETGSGKTEILKNIAARGEQVIDLEAIAHHKGSAFGSLGENPQPTQEHFENKLHAAFSKLDPSRRIWLEDESRNIGRTQIPLVLWGKMKQATVFRVNIPKTLRIERLMSDYGNFSKEELKESILKIRQRLGPQHVKRTLEELEKGNLQEVAYIALMYYDKAYNYHLEMRKTKDVYVIESETNDADANTDKILEFVKNKYQKEYD